MKKHRSKGPKLFLKYKTFRFRGQRHEDKQRLIEVHYVDKRADTVGVVLKHKQSGYTVKFGVSREGWNVLTRLVRKVFAGKTMQWTEKHWAPTLPPLPHRRGSPSAARAKRR